MRVTIKSWNAVAAWRWDMPEDDMCGICRNPYDSTCSKCKYPGDECPLCKTSPMALILILRTARPGTRGQVIIFGANNLINLVMGACNHSFHMVRLPQEP